MTKIFPLFLVLLFLSSLDAQLTPPNATANRILGPVTEPSPDLLIGYGDHGVLITPSDLFPNNSYLMHLESRGLDVEDQNEWTISWNSANGRPYHLAYVEYDVVVIGDDDGEITSLLWGFPFFNGNPDGFDDDLVRDSAKNFVNYIDEEGGEVTYRGDELSPFGVGLLKTAMDEIRSTWIYPNEVSASVLDAILLWDWKPDS